MDNVYYKDWINLIKNNENIIYEQCVNIILLAERDECTYGVFIDRDGNIEGNPINNKIRTNKKIKVAEVIPFPFEKNIDKLIKINFRNIFSDVYEYTAYLRFLEVKYPSLNILGDKFELLEECKNVKLLKEWNLAKYNKWFTYYKKLEIDNIYYAVLMHIKSINSFNELYNSKDTQITSKTIGSGECSQCFLQRKGECSGAAYICEDYKPVIDNLINPNWPTSFNLYEKRNYYKN